MANTVLAVEALEAKRLGESKGALKRSGMYVVGKNRKRAPPLFVFPVDNFRFSFGKFSVMIGACLLADKNR